MPLVWMKLQYQATLRLVRTVRMCSYQGKDKGSIAPMDNFTTVETVPSSGRMWGVHHTTTCFPLRSLRHTA